MRAIGLLVFILALDTAIAVDFALNGGTHVPALISFGTVPLIAILLVILLTLPQMLSRARAATPVSATPETEDAGIEARLRALMEQDRLFLQPDITVERLAKRLHLPARSLSGAINRTQRMNMSHYVNQFRLAHAAALLATSDDSVTRIAEQSGFLTRSNFYREFQRVYDQSPTDYRTAQKRAAQPAARS